MFMNGTILGGLKNKDKTTLCLPKHYVFCEQTGDKTMKKKKLLHVYIVHQFAYNEVYASGVTLERESELQEHKILGVYLEKEQAENHRAKQIFDKQKGHNSPYIAVTKHTVRGQQSNLLVFFNNPEMIIMKGNTITLSQKFLEEYKGA